jgi:SAM-dependent methyltransferase
LGEQEKILIHIDKTWAMPNSNTFSINPIKELIERYTDRTKEFIIDPFANTCKIATITNDLNPSYETDYCLDALDFLKLFENDSVDVVLYDPPYYLRQVKECYEGVGIEVTQEHTKASWRAKHLDEIQRVLKTGGKLLSFGWNSNGGGKKRGFEQVEILLVSHGGSKNDTICTVERKV